MEEATKILKTALFNEVKSRTFYRKAAEITNDDESRMVLLELSEKEDDHARYIINRVKNTSYSKEFDLEAYLRYLESTNESPLSLEELKALQACNMKAILKLAISLEKKAMEIYVDLGKNAIGPDLKSLCHELGQEEKVHLNSVTSMLLSLTMDEEERPPL